MKRLFRKVGKTNSRRSISIDRSSAISMTETAYLASATALIWVALYYLPVGGAIFRLVLPLPLALLQIRRRSSIGLEGLFLTVLLLVALMGPVRGPLILFPYGILAVWLGWCWSRCSSWWFSWFSGVFIGVGGFFVRVFALSLLVGENLWVIITRAGAGLLERFIDLFNLQLVPDLNQVQIASIFLVLLQEIIYVLTLHAVAFWLFPRLGGRMPSPPDLLNRLIVIDPL